MKALFSLSIPYGTRKIGKTEGFRLGLDDFGVHRVRGGTCEADKGPSLAQYDCEFRVGKVGASLPEGDFLLA